MQVCTKSIMVGVLLLASALCNGVPHVKNEENFLDAIKRHRVWNVGRPLKLHLGCGQKRLPGFVNVDFPASEHTVQTRVGANVFADISKLKIDNETVDEVRSHHVFEHFDRQTSLAFLCKWHDWLKIGGTLVIETPDFKRSIMLMLDPQYTFAQKQLTLRHIFGSHEAGWAIHCDGWYQEKFEYILEKMGFEDISVVLSNSFKMVPNITVTAKKRKHRSLQEQRKAIEEILRLCMTCANEAPILRVWCNGYEKVIRDMTLS